MVQDRGHDPLHLLDEIELDLYTHGGLNQDTATKIGGIRTSLLECEFETARAEATKLYYRLRGNDEEGVIGNAFALCNALYFPSAA